MKIKKNTRLRKSLFDYFPIKREETSQLWDLNRFFSSDYDPEDIEVFSRVESHYNNHFVINDKKNKTFYR